MQHTMAFAQQEHVRQIVVNFKSGKFARKITSFDEGNANDAKT